MLDHMNNTFQNTVFLDICRCVFKIFLFLSDKIEQTEIEYALGKQRTHKRNSNLKY